MTVAAQMRQRSLQICLAHICPAAVTGDAALGDSPTSTQKGWIVLQPHSSLVRLLHLSCHVSHDSATRCYGANSLSSSTHSGHAVICTQQ